jgi:hypothetical protein
MSCVCIPAKLWLNGFEPFLRRTTDPTMEASCFHARAIENRRLSSKNIKGFLSAAVRREVIELLAFFHEAFVIIKSLKSFLVASLELQQTALKNINNAKVKFMVSVA